MYNGKYMLVHTPEGVCEIKTVLIVQVKCSGQGDTKGQTALGRVVAELLPASDETRRLLSKGGWRIRVYLPIGDIATLGGASGRIEVDATGTLEEVARKAIILFERVITESPFEKEQR